MYLIEITFSIVFIYNIHFEKYVYNEYYSIYEEAICQRSGTTAGCRLRRVNISVNYYYLQVQDNL